jgi:thioredoxin 1
MKQSTGGGLGGYVATLAPVDLISVPFEPTQPVLWTAGDIPMGTVLHLTDANFDAEVLQSDIPVLVDFWAPWCGPCRQIAPIVEQLAQENEGRVKIAKVDVDENPALASRYRIDSIPAILFFKAGDIADELRGAQPKPRLQSAIDRLVG